MHLPDLGGVVTPSRDGTLKKSHRIHAGGEQGVLPFRFVEFSADPLNVR